MTFDLPKGLIMTSSLRKHLSVSGLIRAIYREFCKISDPRSFKNDSSILLKDHLMSGLAVFGLKCPSLLDYDKKRIEPEIRQNLCDLYHVDTPPSDSYMRERLDEVNPDNFRPVFKKLFALTQRGKGLEKFEYLGGYFLISVDATGQFSSSKISCSSCCTRRHRNGTTSYYHQMLGACVVHPNEKNVIPLCPEIIINKEGDSAKNDCESTACKRFLQNFRREHPHLKAIILQDTLGSTAPNIRMIEEHNLKYIIGIKPKSHRYLFDQLETNEETIYYEFTDDEGTYHQFNFLNGASLNKSNPDVKVNALEYRCTSRKGKEFNFSWVTNIGLSTNNVLKISKAGRSRWKVENETFNTLKNLGYNFEHNYGHGKKHLSSVFCLLMMLAFLIDQVQESCCSLFQSCKQAVGTYRNLWAGMRFLFDRIRLSNWETLYLILVKKKRLDTS